MRIHSTNTEIFTSFDDLSDYMAEAPISTVINQNRGNCNGIRTMVIARYYENYTEEIVVFISKQALTEMEAFQEYEGQFEDPNYSCEYASFKSDLEYLANRY